MLYICFIFCNCFHFLINFITFFRLKTISSGAITICFTHKFGTISTAEKERMHPVNAVSITGSICFPNMLTETLCHDHTVLFAYLYGFRTYIDVSHPKLPASLQFQLYYESQLQHDMIAVIWRKSGAIFVAPLIGIMWCTFNNQTGGSTVWFPLDVSAYIPYTHPLCHPQHAWQDGISCLCTFLLFLFILWQKVSHSLC